MTVGIETTPTREELTVGHLRAIVQGGLSQRAFAQMTGIPRSTIGDVLRGTHAPSEATLSRIEEALFPEGFDYGE